AGRMAMWAKKGYCVDRVKKLGKEMRDAGVKFYVGEGMYQGRKHCWIWYKDKILDPSQINDDKSFYSDEWYMSYENFLERYS
ncbi:MAG: hypothetical protein V1709_10340, partial [Planctomycetota bacterium]